MDGDADGLTNMAADEALAAEAVRRGGPVARFYGWREPTLSLGAFQPVAGARAITVDAVVRRPSGGGAILHGTDLTYAAAIPRTPESESDGAGASTKRLARASTGMGCCCFR